MKFCRLKNMEMLTIQYLSLASTKISYYLEENIFLNSYIFVDWEGL